MRWTSLPRLKEKEVLCPVLQNMVCKKPLSITHVAQTVLSYRVLQGTLCYYVEFEPLILVNILTREVSFVYYRHFYPKDQKLNTLFLK